MILFLLIIFFFDYYLCNLTKNIRQTLVYLRLLILIYSFVQTKKKRFKCHALGCNIRQRLIQINFPIQLFPVTTRSRLIFVLIC